MLSAKKELFTPSGGGYQISRSVRLRSSASAYFNKTLTTPTNNKIWTYSVWVKKARPTSNYDSLFSVSDSKVFRFGYSGSDFILNFIDTNTGWYFTTTQVFRDPSAWMHLVLVIDTTDATAGNRTKVYVNGIQVTAFSAKTDPSQNAASSFNTTVAHYIGQAPASGHYFDGYMTEINFIDGQALTPSSFGETNAVTGVWQPKRYAGTYGTNGFYLNFSDNSGVTATTIGKDYSGNGNNWTPSAGISITAGTTYDSMLDVPTPYADGGNGRGNYATLNPLQSAVAPSDGNLKITGATAHRNSLGTINLPSTSKFYFEGFAPAIQRFAFGLAQRTMDLTVDAGSSSVFSGIYGDSSLTRCWNNGTSLFTLSAIAANDVFQIAVDCATGKVWLGRNNTFYSSAGATTGDPVAGTNATFTLANITDYTSVLGVYDNASNSHINFGQRPFTYTPPTGFVALNTQNLPDATIKRGNDYFDIVTRTGTGASVAISSYRFAPDFVWIKARTNAYYHKLLDKVRGANKVLASNATDAEITETQGLMSFDANGYTLGTSSDSTVNNSGSGQTYVDWAWNAGGSTVTNTSGSISSQVRANPTAGFSVVTYTGNGTGGATIGHGLGVAPKMIIVKNRISAVDWGVYHSGVDATSPQNYYLALNTTQARVSSSGAWQNTAPTSSVFTAGASAWVNESGKTFVAYCFAEVAGYSAFGKYTGNGSADGPFVYCGFRPRWVMIKSASVSATDWLIYDTSRNTFNVMDSFLQPNTSAAQGTYALIDALSNGFKIRNTGANGSGETVIYAAFAENPFKLSLAR